MVALAGGRRGLLPDVVGRVRRLIDAGVPKTRIAAQEGIHRATVHKIAANTHPEQTRGRAPRCATCGATVVFPCRRCALVEGTKEQRDKGTKGNSFEVKRFPGAPGFDVRCSPLHSSLPLCPSAPLPFQEEFMSQPQIVIQLEKKADDMAAQAERLRAEAATLDSNAAQLKAAADVLKASAPAKKPAPAAE